jgi:2-dehydro-3-deoxy-D-arabinonate dehydratase
MRAQRRNHGTLAAGHLLAQRELTVHIVRYRHHSSSAARVGVLADGRIRELDGVLSLGSLWALPIEMMRETLDAARGAEVDPGSVTLLAPIDGRTEVWACGVTYEISRQARREESEHAPDIYERIYDAERPELFFKSASWRVAGPGLPIAVRTDSSLTVPEPEVALVVNASGQIVGFTVCNDVSSRSIEGANPLYLPQAKNYLGACALGPMIRPIWEVADPYALGIGLHISRRGATAWTGAASTAQLHRRYEDLVAYLFHSDAHPQGAVLSTGTCLVPPAPFTLEPGDLVRISVDEIGELENPVVRGLDAVKRAMSLADSE